MAQQTRRTRPSDHETASPEQNALARETFGRPYNRLTEAEKGTIEETLNPPAPDADPTSGTSGPSTDGASPTDETPDPTVPQADPSVSSASDGDADTGPNASPVINDAKTATTAEVREWAKAHADEFQGVPEHGRLPEDVRVKFLIAHPGHEIVQPKGKGSKTAAPLKPIPLDAIAFEEVPEDEWGTHPLSEGPAPREAFQIQFDDRVKALHTKWVEAGRPVIRNAPRDRIAISQEYAPAVRKALQSAGTLHKFLVKVQPPVNQPDGRQVIVFTVMDKPKPEKAKTETKPEPTEAEKAAMDEAKTENDAAAE
jgi:hypothetical protein